MGGGADGWRQVRDHVHVRMLSNAGGQELAVAAAWTGAMGAMATATRAASLVKELRPSCLAMCGICAGKRGDVALGDVIVADRVYSFDHGKLIAAEDGREAPSFFHDITTYNLERSWRMDAAAFRRDLGWAKALLPSRPPTKEAQRRWLLRALHAHEQGGGPPPLAHPERAAVFRIATGAQDWADVIIELRREKLLEPGPLKLTEAGRRAAEDDHLLYPDDAPADPAFRVHVGPIATGNAVIEDPRIFYRLRLVGRKTLGVEMEAFAIGYVGDTLPRRAIVAKAVSDHADHDKDDRFREFACRASAAWLLAFLKQHLTPKPADTRAPGSGPPEDPGPRSPFPDLAARWSGDDQPGVGELQQRVERALMLRHPGARAAWKQGPDEVPATLRAFLEVREPRGRHTMLHVVAIVEGDMDEPTLEAFREHIVKRYGTDQPYIEPSIVYTGVAVAAVMDEAGRWRVDLEPLLELQGLLDFRPYLEEQARMLERDPVYPSELFVPQRLAYRVGFGSFEADDALEALDSWLGQDGPQLMLVLGDFGTGKTFLMHELALRLGKRHLEMGRAIVPVLVELRKLEKSRSLDALLGQHFIPERGMRRFDHDAFRYMLEAGRVALLFDGFDELALRVTYAAAAEHLNTVLEAAIGQAKVVITSRTQHFLNDRQVLQALGERARQRGFRMMWSPNTGKLLHVLEGHSKGGLSVAFSPDSRFLASASDDKSIRLWSPNTGKLLRVLEGHSKEVLSVAFSPDGWFLASASAAGSVWLWNPKTNTLLRELEGYSAVVWSVAFSPDGRFLASASADRSVRLWSPDTGKLLRVLECHSQGGLSVAFSPDGRFLASASDDHSVRFWSVEAVLHSDEGACLATIVPGRGGWAACTPDGRYKLGGDAAGLLGFTVGLCRFEPGELDAYPDAFDRPPRRIGEDEPLFTLGA